MSRNENKVILVENDPVIAEQLSQNIMRFGYADCVSVVAEGFDDTALKVIDVEAPIRMGRVIDQIAAVFSREDSQGSNIKYIGSHFFDTFLNVFYPGGGDDGVKLTEKEVALLEILVDAGGAEVSREALLDQVWNYVDGVETHTLETHIYRLRQKIENDSAAPKTLKTGESGYYLSFE